MIQYYIGLDPSLSATGLVVLRHQEELLKQAIISSNNNYSMDQRLQFLVENVRSHIMTYPPDQTRVRIEGLAFSALGKIAELAALHYMLRAMLIGEQLSFSVIPPSAWKKYALGSGNAKKDLLLKMVFKKWKLDVDDDNVAVAYCLARMPESALPIAKKEEKNGKRKTR